MRSLNTMETGQYLRRKPTNIGSVVQMYYVLVEEWYYYSGKRYADVGKVEVTVNP
jgi:hypothetical protein